MSNRREKVSNITKFSIIVRDGDEDKSSIILARKGEIPFQVTMTTAKNWKSWAVVDGFRSPNNIPCSSHKGMVALWSIHRLWEKYPEMESMVTADEKEAEAAAWFLINEETGDFCRCNDKEGKRRLKASESVQGKASPPRMEEIHEEEGDSELEADLVAAGDVEDDEFENFGMQ